MEAGLDSIRTGMRAVVMQVRGKPRLVNRFYRIGIKPGVVIYCRYRSPPLRSASRKTSTWTDSP